MGKNDFFKLNIFYFYMYGCLPANVCVPHMPGACGNQKGALGLLKLDV